jgi:CheY-like chemotaxis protein
LDKLTYDQFVEHLRSALHYLHDPAQLRRSELAFLFRVEKRFDTTLALGQILTDAIRGLKPEPAEPPESRAWRIYDALFFRYVEGFDREAVAHQLGISGRQFRREQRAALEVLASRLWKQFDLETQLPQETWEPKHGTSEVETMSAVTQELAWLKNASPEKPTDLHEALQAVLELARPLARQSNVHLVTKLDDALPELAVPAAALKHCLLNMLSAAIIRAQNGSIRISAKLARGEIALGVECSEPVVRLESISSTETASLDMARHFADLCGGRLFLSQKNMIFAANLTLPVPEQIKVMVVDDNADALQLLQRYVSSTRYHIIGTRDPDKAVELAERISPQVIILDVMMPEIDGWQVLGQLRQHPTTSRIAIVVCTILPQESLALALDANAFLRKPFSRPELLHVLDKQIAWINADPPSVESTGH